MPDAISIKYRAFLSYSHADTGWAKWLHSRLEGFHIDKDLVGRETATGPVPKNLRPIFRDREDFTAGHTLKEQTLAALDASAALIVLCSPGSAKSHYVNEEVRLFKERHPDRPVVPLILDGKPGDAEQECFPPALRFALGPQGQITNAPEQLLAADVREAGDGKELALAKVIARLLGLGTDEVFRRAERQRRRLQRQRMVTAVAIFGLIGGVGGLSYAGILDRSYLTIQTRKLADDYLPSRLLTAEAEKRLKPGDTFQECASCPEMIVIPPGEFIMGSKDLGDPVIDWTPSGRQFNRRSNDSEKPPHMVKIGSPFAVSKYEVTFDEWDVCVAHRGCTLRPEDYGWGRGRRPLINVSLEEFTKEYMPWLLKQTGKTYRLLSEAEWEYAARGLSDPTKRQTIYRWGNEIGTGNGNCNGCKSKWDNRGTAPVGSFKPNPFGLYDMIGNVQEWVEDAYHENYNGAPRDGTAWQDDELKSPPRVLRGGSWDDSPNYIRSAVRHWSQANFRGDHMGFRVARTLLPRNPP
jgi:formylglycine-generating enzyme required for sulfatase activity